MYKFLGKVIIFQKNLYFFINTIFVLQKEKKMHEYRYHLFIKKDSKLKTGYGSGRPKAEGWYYMLISTGGNPPPPPLHPLPVLIQEVGGGGFLAENS